LFEYQATIGLIVGDPSFPPEQTGERLMVGGNTSQFRRMAWHGMAWHGHGHDHDHDAVGWLREVERAG
jgi:hypothetical protein